MLVIAAAQILTNYKIEIAKKKCNNDNTDQQ